MYIYINTYYTPLIMFIADYTCCPVNLPSNHAFFKNFGGASIGCGFTSNLHMCHGQNMAHMIGPWFMVIHPIPGDSKRHGYVFIYIYVYIPMYIYILYLYIYMYIYMAIWPTYEWIDGHQNINYRSYFASQTLSHKPACHIYP